MKLQMFSSFVKMAGKPGGVHIHFSSEHDALLIL